MWMPITQQLFVSIHIPELLVSIEDYSESDNNEQLYFCRGGHKEQRVSLCEGVVY